MDWFESRVLRSARPFVPSGGSLDRQQRSPATAENNATTEDDQAMLQMMADLVLGEIQTEIGRVEKEAERRRREELRLSRQPDYSWLVDWRLRTRQPLGFRESSELELLCAKVRPGEWRRLLEDWRRAARFAESRHEVLNAFRQAVDQIVGDRMQRECRLESVDEHGIGGGGTNGAIEMGQRLEQKGKPQKQRPMTARPRIPYPAQLDVSALLAPQIPPQQQEQLPLEERV